MDGEVAHASAPHTQRQAECSKVRLSRMPCVQKRHLRFFTHVILADDARKVTRHRFSCWLLRRRCCCFSAGVPLLPVSMGSGTSSHKRDACSTCTARRCRLGVCASTTPSRPNDARAASLCLLASFSISESEIGDRRSKKRSPTQGWLAP